jgi:hypothetical protein
MLASAMGRWQCLNLLLAFVGIAGVLSGCGSGSSGKLTDQQRAQRIRAEAYLRSTRVQCARLTCRLTATTRLHSEREAFLIAWPLVFGAVKDPSLAPLKTVGLTLSDRKSGAALSLRCNRNRARQIPEGATSVAAVQNHCAWSWRASY